MFDVEGWTPPWPWVLDLLARRSLVKVAPGIGHDLVPVGVEADQRQLQRGGEPAGERAAGHESSHPGVLGGEGRLIVEEEGLHEARDRGLYSAITDNGGSTFQSGVAPTDKTPGP